MSDAEETISRLAAEIAKIEAVYHNCAHQRQVVVRRPIKGGRVNVWVQCMNCGAGLGARKLADYDVESLPWWDESLPARRAAALTRLSELRLQHWQAEREAEKDNFERRYRLYLRTDHWSHVKHAALSRDGYKCQNCGCPVNAVSSNAHHIMPWGYDTFRQYGYSMLFEVVTLCLRCHDQAHGRAE